MNKIVTKAQAIRNMLLILILFGMVTLVPLRLWSQEIMTTSAGVVAGTTDGITEEATTLQMFVAQYDHLDSLGLEIMNENPAGLQFTVTVMDYGYRKVRQETVTIPQDATGPGFYSVRLNLDTKVGKEYYYSVSAIDTPVYLAYEVTETSGFIYNGPFHYAGTPMGGMNLIAQYHYTQPLTKKWTGLALLGLLALGCLIWLVCDYLEKKSRKAATLVTMEWGLKVIANPLILLFMTIAVVMVGPLHLFSPFIADIIVMELGVILLGLALLYAVNHPKDPAEDIFTVAYLQENLPSILQAICFAYAIQACVNYMNGLYEVFHDIAYRQMLIALGLALLVTFSWKELFRLYHVGLVLVAALCGKMYYNKHLPEMVDEYHVEVLKLTCILAVVLTLIAACMIRMLVEAICRGLQGEKTKQHIWQSITSYSVWYILLTGVLAFGMIYRRNTRMWPIMMVTAFGIFGLRYLFWEKRATLLASVANGLILHFLAGSVYCLAYRPYMSFLYTRYSALFHTVTETATYMSAIFAAILVKVMWKYNKTHSMKACYKEFLLLGIAAAYELFTMSRTGILAIAATGIVLWVVMMQGSFVKKIKLMGTCAGAIILAVVVCFPIQFTLQKAVPAMVGHPHLFEIEDYPEEIDIGDTWDSWYYITFNRFSEMFLYKMIGLPEGSFDLNVYRIQASNSPLQMSVELASVQLVQGNVGFEPQILLDDEFADNYDPDSATVEDMSNGRMDIFRSYLEQMTKEGHEEMGALLNDGSIATHAHNIYLQVAFDHGIVIGMIFVLWVVCSCLRALVYFLRNKEQSSMAALPLAVLVTYASAGVVEWVEHPCNPLGFVLLLVIIPLLFDTRKRN